MSNIFSLRSLTESVSRDMSSNPCSADILRPKLLLKALGKRLKRVGGSLSVTQKEGATMKRPFLVTSNDCQGLHANQRAEIK